MNAYFDNPWLSLGVGLLSQPTMGQGLLTGIQLAQQSQANSLQAAQQQQSMDIANTRRSAYQQVASNVAPFVPVNNNGPINPQDQIAMGLISTGDQELVNKGLGMLSIGIPDGQYGLTPITMFDSQGIPHLFQTHSKGGATEIPFPANMSPSIPVQNQDLGGSIMPFPRIIPGGSKPYPVTKTLPPENQPQNVQRNAQASAVGTATGQNITALSDALSDIDYYSQNVHGLIGSPGFDQIYGIRRVTDPRNIIPGTDASNAQARLGQLDAASFGISIQKMRGLGQLSDAEGKKVSAAFTRATNPKQSPEAARQAWNEVLSYLETARVRAIEKAGGQYPGQKSGAMRRYNPQTGKIE